MHGNFAFHVEGYHVQHVIDSLAHSLVTQLVSAEMSVDYFQKLIDSMLKCLQLIPKAKGNMTKF